MIRHPPMRRLAIGEPDAFASGICWVSLSALVAFVPIRRLPGNGQAHPMLYVKTHPATALARCPTCRARPGELCSRAGSYYRPKTFTMNQPHGGRIRAWAKHQRKAQTR